MPSIPNNVNPYLREGVDFALNVGSIVAPQSVLTGMPTIVDANSLGILVSGFGIGQVKRFVAAAAIRNGANQATIGVGPSPFDNDPNDLAEEITLNGYVNPLIKPDYLQTPNPDNLIGGYVFDALTLQSISYQQPYWDVNGNIAKENPTTIPSLLLNSAIVSVSVNRHITQTVPVGSNIGTIKELVSLGEYDISITGHLVNPNNPFDYPSDYVKILNDYVAAPVAIPVESQFLALFDITTIVIESCDLSQVEGFSGLLTYNIKAISDTPVALAKTPLSNNTTINFSNPNFNPGKPKKPPGA